MFWKSVPRMRLGQKMIYDSNCKNSMHKQYANKVLLANLVEVAQLLTYIQNLDITRDVLQMCCSSQSATV